VAEQIRKAASVIAVRDAPDGPEILVLERGSVNRFLPGYVAFPGGAVDLEDEALATRWFGDEEEAARAASVRELVEEAGLGLTSGGMMRAASLDVVDGAPPSKDQLPEIAHWIAPERVPVRFDARFFAASAPSGLTPTPDGEETAAAWWVPPRVLLSEWEAGARKLYWPTYYTLTWLAKCLRAEDLLGLRFDTREPTDREEAELPRSVFRQD
jgi:8-oxo-dGTP pyrophosphatase MutT (NUDIX family)